MDKEVLLNKIKSLQKDYKLYTKFFEKDRKNLEDKKGDIVESLEKGKQFEDFEEEMEYLMFGYQMKANDINIIASELINLFSLAKLAELDSELEDTEILEKLLENKSKLTFVPTEDGLKERVKGVQKSNTDNVKNSNVYKEVVDKLTSYLKNP